jgi:hypothetical protein
MGAGASVPTNIVSDPFPIDGGTSTRLDLLSTVVNRILSTDDIYDLANLTRGGTCGDYAVFLKENIEKKLKTFIADLGDDKKAVVRYGTSNSSIVDPVVRKKVCSDLATSMVTVIATVVACLGSIQVATKGRGLGLSASQQRGGDIRDVREWLFKKGIIEPYTDVQRVSNLPVKLIMGARQKVRRIEFSLVLVESEKTLSLGALTARSETGVPEEDDMPKGTFRINFLNPINLPAQPADSVLPVRIVDGGGIPWLAGILVKNEFKSFVEGTPSRFFVDVVEDLFRSVKGQNVRVEPYEQVAQANGIFEQLRANANQPQYLHSVLGRFLTERIAGYQPGQTVAAQVQYPWTQQQQIPWQQQPQPYRPPNQQYPGEYQPPGIYQPPRYPLSGQVPVLGRPALIDTTQYDIPPASGKMIQSVFNSFKGQVSAKSNPAAVRAFMLTRAERNRVILTGVCEDEFWKLPTMLAVHPWATFYFLCMRDWTKVGDRSGAPAPGLKPNVSGDVHPQWNEFLDRIAGSYATNDIGITLTRGSADQVRFSDPGKIKGCPAVTGSYKDVGTAVIALRDAYTAHAKRVWSLLDELIFVVDDPATKTQAVVLHPMVTANNAVATKDYVEERANRARDAIRDFYATVEDIYAKAIAAMQKTTASPSASA